MKNFFKNALSTVLSLTIVFSSVLVGFSEVDFASIKFENPFAVKTKAASSSDLTRPPKILCKSE